MIHCSLLSVRNCAWKGLIIIIWLVIKDHWKRLWSWEGLGAGGEGDDRRWDGWMASLTRWTWVWVNSGSLWLTGRPGCGDSGGCKESETTARLNWTEVTRYLNSGVQIMIRIFSSSSFLGSLSVYVGVIHREKCPISLQRWPSDYFICSNLFF